MILPPDAANPAQVTKIPVHGPAPFNTLVIVAGALDATGAGLFSEHEWQTTQAFGSGYVLPHFDPRTASAIAVHSTTAWISRAGPATRPADLSIESASPRFLYSIDDIASVGFSSAGELTVVIDFSIEAPTPPNDWVLNSGDCFAFGPTVGCANVFSVWVSSYALVYEPPLDAHQKRRLTEAKHYRHAVPWAGTMKPIRPLPQGLAPRGGRLPAASGTDVPGPCGCGKKPAAKG